MKKYQALSSCYQLHPSASVVDTNLEFDNFSYHAQPHSKIVKNTPEPEINMIHACSATKFQTMYIYTVLLQLV